MCDRQKANETVFTVFYPLGATHVVARCSLSPTPRPRSPRSRDIRHNQYPFLCFERHAQACPMLSSRSVNLADHPNSSLIFDTSAYTSA